MAIKKFKPRTQTTRHTQLEDRSHLSKQRPLKRFTVGKRARGGRNTAGRITVRHRGGGVKRLLRKIDHRKDKFDIQGVVEVLEYDPNRSAHLALVRYADGERRYVLAARGMTVGSKVISGENVLPVTGNTTQLKNIASGTAVFDVELTKGKGGQLGRSAGTAIQVQGVDPTGRYVQLKMPSGEIRLVHAQCYATIGQVGNEEHMNVKLGKAGRKRRLGIRPTVRGMAMHAEQHPHGGGEGRGVIGRAKDIWGTRIGTKTRRNKRTRKFIIKRRTTKRRRFAKV
ncbi:MAG: 50S ribosomal protein L2 [Candidatus Dojkabacteria bacterium]|nr:50S ribosomal protein L2 [Candidatus Dojkabacteria bacterium]